MNVRVSETAHRGITDTAVRCGVSVAALLEAIGENLADSDGAWRNRVGRRNVEELGKRARVIDAARRQRRMKTPPEGLPIAGG